MSIAPDVNAKTLTQLVARRIKHAMVDEDILQAELSRRMGKTEQWVSVRLRGRQAIDLNDLLLFARALGVQVHDLMPSPEDAAEAAPPRDTSTYPKSAVQPPMHMPRQRGNRPPGHPSGSTTPGVARTAYVDRPDRRKRG